MSSEPAARLQHDGPKPTFCKYNPHYSNLYTNSIKNPRKRKATNELSTNTNTVKVRQRNERIAQDPIQDKVEKAKRADQGAITYAKKKLVQTQEYRDATEERKQQLIDASAHKVMLRR